MRPSGITDGIIRAAVVEPLVEARTASMRPSGITDGIAVPAPPSPRPRRFNEAVGYYRRNRRRCSDWRPGYLALQ